MKAKRLIELLEKHDGETEVVFVDQTHQITHFVDFLIYNTQDKQLELQ